MEFTLTTQKYEAFAENVLRKRIKEWLDLMFQEILMTSPYFSGKYQKGHINKGVRKEGNLIIGEIENIGEYPERVEEGFGPGGRIGGRATKVVWHLVNGTLYYNYGAKTYKKAVVKFQKLIGQ